MLLPSASLPITVLSSTAGAGLGLGLGEGLGLSEGLGTGVAALIRSLNVMLLPSASLPITVLSSVLTAWSVVVSMPKSLEFNTLPSAPSMLKSPKSAERKLVLASESATEAATSGSAELAAPRSTGTPAAGLSVVFTPEMVSHEPVTEPTRASMSLVSVLPEAIRNISSSTLGVPVVAGTPPALLIVSATETAGFVLPAIIADRMSAGVIPISVASLFTAAVVASAGLIPNVLFAAIASATVLEIEVFLALS
jgi:hypothetical protein